VGNQAQRDISIYRHSHCMIPPHSGGGCNRNADKDLAIGDHAYHQMGGHSSCRSRRRRPGRHSFSQHPCRIIDLNLKRSRGFDPHLLPGDSRSRRHLDGAGTSPQAGIHIAGDGSASANLIKAGSKPGNGEGPVGERLYGRRLLSSSKACTRTVAATPTPFALITVPLILAEGKGALPRQAVSNIAPRKMPIFDRRNGLGIASRSRDWSYKFLQQLPADDQAVICRAVIQLFVTLLTSLLVLDLLYTSLTGRVKYFASKFSKSRRGYWPLQIYSAADRVLRVVRQPVTPAPVSILPGGTRASQPPPAPTPLRRWPGRPRGAPGW
jgi:hypothetical protein